MESPDNNQDSGVGDNVETDESDSETSKPSSRKQRKENNPQAIGFYKAPWNRALKLAKKAYHHLIFSEHGFPIRELHLGEASRLISRIVAEMRVEDPELVFEPGKVYIIFAYVIFQRYHYRYSYKGHGSSSKPIPNPIIISIILCFRSLRKELRTDLR